MTSKQQYKQFNCYQILNVPPTATPQEIKSGYKKASLQHHPDTGGSHDVQVNIILAYEVLSDPIQRQAHDTYYQISINSRSAKPKVSEFNRVHKTHTQSQERSPESNKNQHKNHHREPLSSLKNRIYQEIAKEKEKIFEDLNNQSRIRK